MPGLPNKFLDWEDNFSHPDFSVTCLTMRGGRNSIVGVAGRGRAPRLQGPNWNCNCNCDRNGPVMPAEPTNYTYGTP